MTKTFNYYPWQALQLTPPHTPNSPQLLSIKKCHKNPILADDEMFPHFASWQSVADLDVLIKKIATVGMDLLVISQPCKMKRVCFLTLEAWLIRRIRSSCLTRQRSLWYLSRQRQAEWSWLSEDSVNVWQGRTGQDRAGWEQNEERTGFFIG